MELEFKCLSQGCSFVAKVNWPEEKLIDGEPALENQMHGETAITEHHRFTRPANTRWYGHGSYETVVNNHPITVSVSSDGAFIDLKHFDFLYGKRKES